jgi:hypothetical protein
MLFGIQASHDVKLCNIPGTLQEDISLIKTEDRLSRNLQAEELEPYPRTGRCPIAPFVAPVNTKFRPRCRIPPFSTIETIFVEQ